MADYLDDKAGAREDMCRFLSACYYEPCTEFGEERLFDSMLAAARVIDPELAERAGRLGAAFAAEDMETLLVDHTALFIGPSQPKAMPYASFWLTDDQSMRHEATTAVLDWYAQGGFDVSEELHDLPDHVAVELEFLYALTYGKNAAQNAVKDSGATAALASAEEIRRRFLREHLAVWIGAFTAAAKAGATTVFYRELAELTERFVRLEVDGVQ